MPAYPHLRREKEKMGTRKLLVSAYFFCCCGDWPPVDKMLGRAANISTFMVRIKHLKSNRSRCLVRKYLTAHRKEQKVLVPHPHAPPQFDQRSTVLIIKGGPGGGALLISYWTFRQRKAGGLWCFKMGSRCRRYKGDGESPRNPRRNLNLPNFLKFGSAP